MKKGKVVVLTIVMAVAAIYGIITLNSSLYALNGGKEDGSEDRCVKLDPDTSAGVQTELDREKQANASQTLSRLDFNSLDNLPNEKYGWGLVNNLDHKLPELPLATEQLLERYDAKYKGPEGKNKVYLTFDEGYENGYTPLILDTLKKNNVKAIFFVTRPYVVRNPELVERMLNEGHQVGNHSVTHPSLPEVDNITLEKELAEFDDFFYSRYGVHFSYMRPPKGEYSERILEASRQLGYKTVFWSYTYLDYDVNNQKGSEYAFQMVMDHLHDGAVILLHAVSKDNAEALDRIISGIREEGFEISPFNL